MKAMRKAENRKRIFIIAGMWILLMMLAALAPMAAEASDGQLRLTVEQTFTSSSASVDNVFTYRLKGQGAGTPMPSGSTGEGYTFTIAGSHSIEIGPMVYDKASIYRYELYQVIAAELPGYTYDTRVYTLEVYVDAWRNVELVVWNRDGTKAEKIRFENAYYVLPSDPGLMVDPPVRKTVFGNPNRDSTFRFTLTANEMPQPMPQGSVGGVKTIEVVGSGRGEFGVWSYDRAGTYYYTVRELNTGLSGYTYDTTVYTITDMVSEKNGQLVVYRVVANNLNKPVAALAFLNQYSPVIIPGGENPRPSIIPGGVITDAGPPGGGLDENAPDPVGERDLPRIDGPKTGDDSDLALSVSLLAAGGLMAIGAVWLLGRERKHSSRPSPR